MSVFPRRNEFDEETVVRFKHRHDARGLKPGVRVKSDNKPVMCQNLKKLTEGNRFTFDEKLTVEEASMFGTMKNGTYGGQHVNDDVIMTMVTITEFFGTTDYADMVEELLDVIDESKHEKMEIILYKDTAGDGDLQYDIYDLLS